MSEPKEGMFDGAVIERATSEGGVLDLTWAWVEQHWLDLMTALPAVALTLILTDFCKEPLKLYLAHKLGKRYNERIENVAVRTLSLFAAAIWAYVLNFTESWNAIAPWELSQPRGLLVGTFLTAGLTWLAVWFIGYFDIAETARVRFQRLSGVTKADIERAKTVRTDEQREQPDNEAKK